MISIRCNWFRKEKKITAKCFKWDVEKKSVQIPSFLWNQCYLINKYRSLWNAATDFSPPRRRNFHLLIFFFRWHILNAAWNGKLKNERRTRTRVFGDETCGGFYADYKKCRGEKKCINYAEGWRSGTRDRLSIYSWIFFPSFFPRLFSSIFSSVALKLSASSRVSFSCLGIF